MLADLVVLSDDVLRVAEKALADVHVDMTVVEGKVAYERGGGEG
jgi:predicted amidohydrolase YtcJ